MNNREIDGSNRWEQESRKWNQYYASLPLGEETEETRLLGQELLDKILNILPDGGRILEAGCGGGWQSLALARSGKYKISLLDFSAEALNYARKVFEQAQLEVDTLLENFLNAGKPEYDIVFNAGVLEHYTFEEQVELLKGL